jgi:hypothetical protein
MPGVKYRAIINDAWVLTQENKRLIWWFAFAPALLSTLVAMVYLGYQAAAFWTSPYFRAQSANEEQIMHSIMTTALNLLKNEPGLAVLIIVVLAIVGLTYLMLPVFTQGALIQLVARYKAGHPISIRAGFSYGFSRFLQLFEYHLAVKTFSLVGILTQAAFVLRNLGPDAFAVFMWIFLIVLLVGLVLSLLFTYSEYYIVIDKTGVFNGMLSSSGLVFRQWHHTLFMFFLMAIISLRIVFNILVALLIPLLVIGPIFLFASFTLTGIGVAIGLIIGAVALYFASYFLGIFHVFATAVWTFTFIELTTKEDDKDLREEIELVQKNEDQIENTER